MSRKVQLKRSTARLRSTACERSVTTLSSDCAKRAEAVRVSTVGAFGARVERWGAAPAPPRLFLYYALHDTHAPLEAPWAYVAPYAAAFPQDTKVRA